MPGDPRVTDLFDEGSDPNAQPVPEDVRKGLQDFSEHQPLRENTTTTTPFSDQPLVDRIAQSVKGTPLDALRSLLENAGNTALASGADELQSAAMNPPGNISVDPGGITYIPEAARPKEPPNEYAAGSRFEDNRRTLEAERHERDQTNPKSAFGGQMLGTALQAAALPENMAAQVVNPKARAALNLLGDFATNAGATSAQFLGEGSGDLSERANQALDTAGEHKLLTTAAYLAPLLGKGMGKGAESAAEKWRKGAAKNTTIAALPTEVRKAIASRDADEGTESLIQLGQDMRDRGLHKTGNMLPPNAETFSENALKLKKKAAGQMDTLENEIKLADPDPYTGEARGGPVMPGVHDVPTALEDKAADVRKLFSDPQGQEAEAAYREQQAAAMREKLTEPGIGPVPAEYEYPTTIETEGSQAAQKAHAKAQAKAQKDYERKQKAYERDLKAYNKAITPPDPPKGMTIYAGEQDHPQLGQWFNHFKALENAKAEGAEKLPFEPQSVTAPKKVEIQPSIAKVKAWEAKAEKAMENEANLKKPVPPQAPQAQAGPPLPPPILQPGPRLSGPALPATGMQGPMPGPTWKEAHGLPRQNRDVRFGEARENLNDLRKRIDYERGGGYEGAPMKEQVKRENAANILGALDEGLDDAAARGEVRSGLPKEYKDAKKDFGVAATVAEPALLKSIAEEGSGFNMNNMAGAGILGGLPGMTAVGGNEAMRGRWPGWKANQQARLSKAAKFGSNTVPAAGEYTGTVARTAIEQARANYPDAPKAKVEQVANESLKDQIAELLKEGKDWFSHLID